MVTMSLQDETGLFKGKIKTGDKAREKATDHQWKLVEEAINAFVAKYPHVWIAFCEDTKKEQSAHDTLNRHAFLMSPSGKKVKTDRRKTATFPSAQWYDEDGDMRTDSLLWVLEGIIPGLCHTESVNYAQFLKRFPIFRPTWKNNVSNEKLG
jgi:hypothetical protein